MATIVNVDELMLTSLEYADFYVPSSQEFLFRLEELQDWTVNGEQTVNTINGARGVPLAAIKSAKGCSGSMTNGIISLGGIAADIGADVNKNQTYNLRWTEVIKVTTANTVTINYTPAGTPANMYLVGKQDANGSVRTVYAKTAEATPDAGEYKIAGKVITFHTGDVAVGDLIIVKYDREMPGATIITNAPDHYSADVTMVATFIGEDKNCNQYLVQAYFPKVTFNGDTSWGAGDDQKTFDINWTAFAARCNGTGNKFYDLAVISEDDVEAPEE